MVTLERLDATGVQPGLGEACRFGLRGEPLERIDYFLEHEGIIYTHSLQAETDGSVWLYPEAPGRYTLRAVWRALTGERGWTQTEFDVKGPQGSQPRSVSAQGETLWVPTAWDAHTLGAHEQHLVRALQPLVRPGSVVYDIGANVGLFSLRFARWIGPAGRLYAIEPNPICVSFLRANLERARLTNFTILPLAVGEGRGDIEFSLNYGSSLVGVGSGSTGVGKPGHRIRVPSESLDRLIDEFNLRRPDLIKLDVEGAEAGAVSGMLATLERTRPSVAIELHGRQAAAPTLRHLAGLGYRYRLPLTGESYRNADELLDALPDACVQIIGLP